MRVPERVYMRIPGRDRQLLDGEGTR
jgi:hypothetical protein